MGPKMLAAIRFIEAGGDEAIIAELSQLPDANGEELDYDAQGKTDGVRHSVCTAFLPTIARVLRTYTSFLVTMCHRNTLPEALSIVLTEAVLSSTLSLVYCITLHALETTVRD